MLGASVLDIQPIQGVHVYRIYTLSIGSLVPRLSSRANEKSKERGEPGKIYHVRNIIGRENLITCGRTKELAHALWTEYTRSVTIALWPTEWD